MVSSETKVTELRASWRGTLTRINATIFGIVIVLVELDDVVARDAVTGRHETAVRVVHRRRAGMGPERVPSGYQVTWERRHWRVRLQWTERQCTRELLLHVLHNEHGESIGRKSEHAGTMVRKTNVR